MVGYDFSSIGGIIVRLVKVNIRDSCKDKRKMMSREKASQADQMGKEEGGLKEGNGVKRGERGSGKTGEVQQIRNRLK